MDYRSTGEADELAQTLGGEYIYRNTGWRANPSLDAAKIMSMKRSGKYAGAKYYISTIEYMNYFLTGNPVCDPTNASMRQVFNVRRGEYDDRILEAAGILREELPDVAPTGAPVGGITPEAAAATGLREGTPVYNGAHDQYCASIGAGAVKPGDLLLSAGTAWVVLGIGDKPLFTDTYIAPAKHPIPGLYGAIASIVGGGASLQWFKNNFMDEDFKTIDGAAARRGAKTGELFFYPYLSGAGYPLWNLDTRGAFTGIALEHDKYDFARAIMEASAFKVRMTLEDFAANGFMPKTLRIMGGAAKSELWLGLIAAASGVSAEVSGNSEACVLGAAIIAAKGAGAFSCFEEAASAMSAKTRLIEPDRELAETLSEKYTKYRRMWSYIAEYYIKRP
jgi:sugar (pentulose or hexulose) kinase